MQTTKFDKWIPCQCGCVVNCRAGIEGFEIVHDHSADKQTVKKHYILKARTESGQLNRISLSLKDMRELSALLSKVIISTKE